MFPNKALNSLMQRGKMTWLQHPMLKNERLLPMRFNFSRQIKESSTRDIDIGIKTGSHTLRPNATVYLYISLLAIRKFTKRGERERERVGEEQNVVEPF